jgi:hypothetical protein
MRHRFLFLIPLLILAACAPTEPEIDPFELDDPYAVPLDDWGTLALPTPPWPRHAAPMKAALTIDARPAAGSETTLRGTLSMDHAGVALSLSDVHGRPAVLASWTDLGATVDRGDGLPPWMDGRRLLADLVMMHWPQTLVRSALPATLEVEDAKTARRITVRATGAPYLDIRLPPVEPWAGQASLVNRAAGYVMRVRATPLGAPSPHQGQTTIPPGL